MSEQRLIDANAALSDLKNSVFPSSMTYTVGVDIAKRLIESAPTVDPNKYAEWVKGVCSNCKYNWAKDAPIAGVPNYCPNCGSLMGV